MNVKKIMAIAPVILSVYATEMLAMENNNISNEPGYGINPPVRQNNLETRKKSKRTYNIHNNNINNINSIDDKNTIRKKTVNVKRNLGGNSQFKEGFNDTMELRNYIDNYQGEFKEFFQNHQEDMEYNNININNNINIGYDNNDKSTVIKKDENVYLNNSNSTNNKNNQGYFNERNEQINQNEQINKNNIINQFELEKKVKKAPEPYMMVDTVFDLSKKFAQKFCEQMKKDMLPKPRRFCFADEKTVKEVSKLHQDFLKPITMAANLFPKPRRFCFADKQTVKEVSYLHKQFAQNFYEQMKKDMPQKPRRFCFANDLIEDKKSKKPAPMERPVVQKRPNAKKIFKKQ